MEESPGFHRLEILRSVDRPDEMVLHCHWSDRGALDLFMRDRHDRLEAETKIQQTYDSVAVDFLESEPDSQAAVSLTGSWRAMALASEAYRASIAIRIGLLSGFVDALGEGAGLDRATERSGLAPLHARKLANILKALGIAEEREERWRLTEEGSRFFGRDAAEPLRDLVLHNAHVDLIDRWNRLDERLGTPRPQSPHLARLLAAMDAIARSGQAEAIAELIARQSRPGRLLDVGGATGGNAIALAARFPELHIDLLDLAGAADKAGSAIASAGLGGRIRFIAGDYRAALPPGPYDSILLANVLRGETEDEALALLRRCRASLAPEGILWVVDLLQSGEGGESDLMAALFGLHLPDAIVPSLDTVGNLLGEAGYAGIERHRIEPARIANFAILARPG